MPESSTLPSYYLDWLKVWQAPWQSMHPSWETCIPSAESTQGMWLRSAPCYLRSLLSISDVVPPKPGEALQQWLQMSGITRMHALRLAAEIVVPNISDITLSQDEKMWGRHIAKALTPGKWPVHDWKSRSAEQMGLLLIRQWLSPAAWQRVRLFYDKQLHDKVASEALVSIPENRLNQLWHAVMWRLSQSQYATEQAIETQTDEQERAY